MAPIPAGASVLALGDSITWGTGATPETSYPAVLARLTGWDVVNAGVPDDTSASAQVLLVGVPDASAIAAITRSLSDHPMYEELTAELKLPLHQGGWSEVLSDPALRSDPIHANASGYAAFARGLTETARKLGLWVPR